MITAMNKSKTLTNHISCECKYKFDDRKCNANQKWNNDKHRCEYQNKKNILCVKKYIFEILLHLIERVANM